MIVETTVDIKTGTALEKLADMPNYLDAAE